MHCVTVGDCVTQANNQLQALPTPAGCSRLKVLSLTQNKLVTLPPGLGACTALLELHAGYNCLTAIPAELAGCSSLRTLVVRDNRIASVPVEVSASLAGKQPQGIMPQIERTAMQCCETQRSSIQGLRRVSCVVLMSCELTLTCVTPVPQVCSLQLSVFDLQACDITGAGLPPQLGLMTSLKSLLLDGNPLRTLRRPLITGKQHQSWSSTARSPA
jgi:Leucine-rich repeat (LRR) protein